MIGPAFDCEGVSAGCDTFDPAWFRAASPPSPTQPEDVGTLNAESQQRHGAKAARRAEEFHTVYAAGLDELVRRTRSSLAVLVALEAVRLVVTGRDVCLRLSSEGTARWLMTRKERRTTAAALRAMPDLFDVSQLTGRGVVTVTPTPAALAMLFRKQGAR
jgi:hypothetical protein